MKRTGNEEEFAGNEQLENCFLKSISIKWKNATANRSEKLEGKIALFPRYSGNDCFLDIFVTEGSEVFEGRYVTINLPYPFYTLS